MSIKTCPFFNICGGCRFDFSDENYHVKKSELLPKLNYTDDPIWGENSIFGKSEFDERGVAVPLWLEGCPQRGRGVAVPLWLEGCPQRGRGVAYKMLPKNPKLKEYATELRKVGSLPEALLWKELKNKQINGLNFNRQIVIGNYIVDFFCPQIGLVIEIDDKTHDFKAKYDEKREKFLLSFGLTILHVSAKEVLTDISSVVEYIKRHPSGQRGTCFGFQNKQSSHLVNVSDIPLRRRAEFAFNGNHFGFYKKQTKDIVDITNCINVLPEINTVLPDVAKLPWNGSGSVLITKCENGIDIVVTSIVPHFNAEFRKAVELLPHEIIRFVWNDKEIIKRAQPQIRFNDTVVDYPPHAFLQPTIETEKILRDMVVKAVGDAKQVCDLFCGLGNFTYATHATGFDIFGNGITRDLFKKPLLAKNLNNYNVVIMDPPRAGAESQSKELAKSDVKKIVYVSCNPNTFVRDMNILMRGGYKMSVAVPVDQFVGSQHWEIFSIFEK